MKNRILLLSILFIAFSFLLPACKRDAPTLVPYTYYKSVFKSRAEVRANIKSVPPRNVMQAGKISIQNNTLFLVDVNSGIHVIDITNISQPQNIAFIPIPGCNDLTIRGNYLYADLGTDLVTVDVSNPTSATLKNVVPNVFPYNYSLGYPPDTSKVFAGLIRVDTAITNNTNKNILVYFFSTPAASQASYTTVSTTNGVSGSTSRFGLLNDRMYAVGTADLKIFNTANASSPTFIKKTSLNQGNIETIFPYGNNLFIGSQSGMFIYDASNPDSPTKLSQFTHAKSCDPVIADGNTAYVTLHAGSACGGFSNQMDVLDITSLTNPVFIKTYALTSPRGLAKDGNLLLICDGSDGLKIFNAATANNISLVKQVPITDAQDVIAYKNTAIVTATNGLYFVDYRDPANAKITGFISVGN